MSAVTTFRSGLARLVPGPFTDMNKRSLGIVALACIGALALKKCLPTLIARP